MAYPSTTALRSIAGSAKPSYPTTTLSSTYVETTFTIADASTWKEVGTNGQNTSNALGTSGYFVVVVDFGLSTEEHILCSGVNTSTGVITIWTDGTRNGRGWDGTPISAHSAGSSSSYNCFPFVGGTDFAAMTSVISGIPTTYAPLLSPTLNPSGTSAVGLIVKGLASQTGDLAQFQNSAGTSLVSVSSAGLLTLNSQKITGLANGTTATDAVAYGQWIGQTLTPVVKTTSYTATAGDFVIMNGSGATTTTLPTTPANGTMIGLLNVGTGTASIAAGGSDTIRGSTTSAASGSSSQYQTLVVSYNSASGVWEQVIADANKGYLSRTNSWVGANTFSNTVTNNGLTVMGPTASVTGPSLTVKQPVQTATVTAASGNGTTVTYTANNSFTAGNSVSITGLGIASGSSLNLTNVTIATVSSTQFTVANTTVGVSSGTGTATSYSSSQYALQVQNAGGTAVLQTGNTSSGTTNLTEALNHTGSFINVANASFLGTLSLRNYQSGNLPGLVVYQNGANTGDLVSLRTTSTNTVLRANTSGAWVTGGGATSFVVRAVQNTASITVISGNGTTITVTANNYFSAGQTVVITGTTNYNGTYTIATATGASFTITSATTGATSTGTATTTGQTADILAVQDSAGTAVFGISNTGSAGSPVWAVNAYSGKIINVANGSASSDAVAYGQLASYAPLVSPSFTTPSLGVATATSINGTTIPSSATLVTTATTSLPNLTTVNGTSIPSSATLITSDTTSLPNVTSVNGTTIPSSATLLTSASTSSALTKVGLASAGFVKSDASGNLSVDTNTYVTPTYSGEISATDFKATGLTGATTATRYVGGTVNGAPASGTFAVGDFIIDQTATIWVCTTAGTPGTWWSTISNHMVPRSATATAKVNEVTVFTGATGQTISAPPNPQDGASWSVINRSANVLTLSFASNSMLPLGGASSVTTYTVSPNATYSFINNSGAQWYMTATNGADHLVDTLGTANGGTGLTGFTAANNAIYSTSSSALTAGTLPVLAGGTGVTTSTGSGNTVLSSAPTLSAPIINNAVFTAPAEKVAIDTTTQLSGSNTANVVLTTSGYYLFTNASGPTANYTINIDTRSSGLATGQAITVAVVVLNGTTPYLPTTISIQTSGGTTTLGTSASNANVWWQGTGLVWPLAADASHYDAYTITIVQTGASAWTAFAAITKF